MRSKLQKYKDLYINGKLIHKSKTLNRIRKSPIGSIHYIPDDFDDDDPDDDLDI